MRIQRLLPESQTNSNGELVDVSRLELLLSKYKGKKGSLIPLLQGAQEVFGFIPRKAFEKISAETGISLSDMYGVATFYAQFNLNPAGRHTIYVCEGTSCHVKGGKKLLNKIGELLNIKVKETTEDKRFTLKVVRCLGCCGISPTIMVNNETYGRVRSADLTKILSKFE